VFEVESAFNDLESARVSADQAVADLDLAAGCFAERALGLRGGDEVVVSNLEGVWRVVDVGLRDVMRRGSRQFRVTVRRDDVVVHLWPGEDRTEIRRVTPGGLVPVWVRA
jgi:hypothetical protein